MRDEELVQILSVPIDSDAELSKHSKPNIARMACKVASKRRRSCGQSRWWIGILLEIASGLEGTLGRQFRRRARAMRSEEKSTGERRLEDIGGRALIIVVCTGHGGRGWKVRGCARAS